MNNVVCLKHGTKYGAEYVNTLYRMVQRNLTVPHRFVCFTEDTSGIDSKIDIIKLDVRPGINGWWYKPTIFNPKSGLTGTVLYLDLDVIVFKNIDNLFDYQKNQFCIIRDFIRSQVKNYKKVNSSCFRFDVGKDLGLYDSFEKETNYAIRKYMGDQDWIFSVIKDKPFFYWPDEWIQSYKWEMRGRPQMIGSKGNKNFVAAGEPIVKPNTSIAVFHGEPNPKDCIDPWCKQHWH